MNKTNIIEGTVEGLYRCRMTGGTVLVAAEHPCEAAEVAAVFSAKSANKGADPLGWTVVQQRTDAVSRSFDFAVVYLGFTHTVTVDVSSVRALDVQ